MIDLFGLVTRALLALATPAAHAPAHTPAPAPAHVVTSIPLVGTPGPVAGAGQVTADQALDKIQAFYASISSVSAKFRQHVANPQFGTDKTSNGAVLIAKPGKMRWDYYETRKEKGKDVTANTKTFVSNGSYLYVVEYDNKQVSKKNLQNEAMPVAISFLYGKGDLKATFTAALNPTSSYAGKDRLVITLTPKEKSTQYKTLELVVSTTDYHVLQSILTDGNNNTNRFEFFEPNFKAAIPDTRFTFDPKKDTPNYRLIDLDQQQQAGGPPVLAPTK